jgi:hypothetical protein
MMNALRDRDLLSAEKALYTYFDSSSWRTLCLQHGIALFVYSLIIII